MGKWSQLVVVFAWKPGNVCYRWLPLTCAFVMSRCVVSGVAPCFMQLTPTYSLLRLVESPANCLISGSGFNPNWTIILSLSDMLLSSRIFPLLVRRIDMWFLYCPIVLGPRLV